IKPTAKNMKTLVALPSLKKRGNASPKRQVVKLTHSIKRRRPILSA
ncbi:hypothetical protein AAUPMB_13011, partial [Pasteurella multocida subsp. multocida str. Anand1_buffalo]